MSDQLSAPRDPGSYGSRRRTGLGVGALILFGIACVAGGYSLARFGPTLPELYPDKPRAGAAAEIAPLAAPAPAPWRAVGEVEHHLNHKSQTHRLLRAEGDADGL
ncbi:hypothetical protein OUA97_22440, partial [Phenylobacterium sp. 58.2.17]|nr:hypothetical protein [Phenylobacterium sp. 58.2.17]